MSHVIKLLEKLGQQPTLGPFIESNIQRLLNGEHVDKEIVDMIINADNEGIARMLDTRSKIVAFLAPAKDDEDEETSEDENDDKDDVKESNQVIASK
ncbi:hypothetical protein [Aliikangiella sp. IMCC44359]|uniref:hypothetical protein n=1 Tax=Aliikangiella sp. IMCC44359 TaxID=3459125 RepID=UPI00403AD0FA